MRLAFAAFAVALLIWPAAGKAEGLAKPAGQGILTVTGAITKTNRGPFDAFEDSFFKFHERHFEKAATFDLVMLESLAQHEMTITYAGWPKPFRFQGPWLKDVLAAAGATGKDITVLALDGYATEIKATDLGAYDWLVAVKRDGRYLDIGQRGPLYLVYARHDNKPIAQEDEERWPFAAFMIEVK